MYNLASDSSMFFWLISLVDMRIFGLRPMTDPLDLVSLGHLLTIVFIFKFYLYSITVLYLQMVSLGPHLLEPSMKI